MIEYSRNSEEALLVICAACSRKTNIITPIKWAKPNNFGMWIKKMQGQRTGEGNRLFTKHLTKINFSNQVIELGDFSGYSFEKSILCEVKAFGCHFDNTNFSKCDLSYSDLSGTNLAYANLKEANLSYADLSHTTVSRADLSSADLSSADLSSADLSSADLSGANLSGAILVGSNFRRAKITNTSFKDTDISMVNLEVAHSEDEQDAFLQSWVDSLKIQF